MKKILLSLISVQLFGATVQQTGATYDTCVAQCYKHNPNFYVFLRNEENYCQVYCKQPWFVKRMQEQSL